MSKKLELPRLTDEMVDEFMAEVDRGHLPTNIPDGAGLTILRIEG